MPCLESCLALPCLILSCLVLSCLASCILYLVSCILYLVSCLLSLVSCLLSLVSCLLSLVSCLLSLVSVSVSVFVFVFVCVFVLPYPSVCPLSCSAFIRRTLSPAPKPSFYPCCVLSLCRAFTLSCLIFGPACIVVCPIQGIGPRMFYLF